MNQDTVVITSNMPEPAVPPVQGKDTKATRPSVVNINIVSENKEYSHKLPWGCKRITLQVRDDRDLRISFDKGIVATPNPGYFTIKENTVLPMDGLDVDTDVWIYMACDSGGKVVEIIQWS